MQRGRQPKWKQPAARAAVEPRVVRPGSLRAAKGPFEFLAEAVGSGVVVCAHDARSHVAAMLHFVMPHSGVDPRLAEEETFLFGDVAVPRLVENLEAMGASLRRLDVWVVGGAGMENLPASLHVGARNVAVAVEALKARGLDVRGQEIGGAFSRSVLFRPMVNTVEVTSVGRELLRLG